MVVDAQGTLVINVLGNPWAHIDAMRVLDAATGTWYSTFPEGQQAYCTAGALCWINLRLQNAGNISGTIYITMTRNDGGSISNGNQSFALAPGGYVDIDNISLTMPQGNLSINFEIGHS